jgi:hypothetical protein
LEFCVDECFEDMGPKRARGLVKLSVILLELFLVGTHTPAIATDLISDMMKIATGVLQFFYPN